MMVRRLTRLVAVTFKYNSHLNLTTRYIFAHENDKARGDKA
jgi:hypothetical protein